MLPEHTVEGYRLALKQGADVIECDVAVSKVSAFYNYMVHETLQKFLISI